MERGQLGALNYQMAFPGQQQVDPAQVAMQQQAVDPYQYQLPDKLANRQAKTKQLIERYNNLKSLAAEFERLGEVWDRPDLSQDDGGLAYQTILAADAGVKYAAQELANEAEAEQQLRPLEAQGKIRFNQGVDPTQDLAYSDPSKYYSTDPMPFVDEANRRLNTPTYTTRDQNNFNQAYLNPNLQRIDQMVASGQMSPEEGEFQKANLQRNEAQTAYQQLIPRGSGRGSGLSQEDISRRAEFIKQIKKGIVTNDQGPLNMLKLVPGVEDIEYVNTGDEVGLQIYLKNQDQPAFIDLSQGGGEADINAFLNRIEGQKNVPNEAVFSFDTKVEIPKSNVKPIIDNLKSSIKELPETFVTEALPKLQQLAMEGALQTPDGFKIASIEYSGPTWGIFGSKELEVKYYDNKGKLKTKYIKNDSELESLVDSNANYIAPAFGGGFGEPAQPTLTPAQQKAQDLINKYRK
jgi:hypothetical protein